jgi:hypothetical protein
VINDSARNGSKRETPQPRTPAAVQTQGQRVRGSRDPNRAGPSSPALKNLHRLIEMMPFIVRHVFKVIG